MHLCDCFMEMIAYVNYFLKQKDDINLSVDKVRVEIINLIEKSEKISAEIGISDIDYDTAKFAVIVWTDERIMQSSWEGKSLWRKNLLQKEYYKTTGGGVEFYNKLGALEPDQNEVREVYYLCLVSGFQGVYGTSNDDIIIRDDIKSKNLKRLTGTSDGIVSTANDVLFEDAYCNNFALSQKPLEGKVLGFSPFSALAVFSPLVVFVGLFFLYRFILNNEMITILVPQ